MPYDWVEPEIFLEHGPHTIYHVYRNDQIQDLRRSHKFSLTELGCDEDSKRQGVFDITELPGYCQPSAEEMSEYAYHRKFLREQLDAGTFDDWELENGAGDTYKEHIAAMQAARAAALEIPCPLLSPVLDVSLIANYLDAMPVLEALYEEDNRQTEYGEDWVVWCREHELSVAQHVRIWWAKQTVEYQVDTIVRYISHAQDRVTAYENMLRKANEVHRAMTKGAKS